MFVVDTLQSALASLGRMIGVVTLPVPEVETSTAPAGPTAVRLSEVAFSYGSGPLALEDLSLDIPAGQHLAVVGPSGAGKTTLAAVIAGVHRPDTGSVTRPTRTAVITQELHVFAGTLRENLTLAAPDATDQEIRDALEATGGAGLLPLLADGLDTVVGAHGYALTDPQAQQLALARLLLADPELAILDEATAEAGSAQARQLEIASEAVLAGRTGLVIAHRLSQAASCDRIVVMDKGRIIETGTHTELTAARGVYGELWRAWQEGRAVAGRDGSP